LAVALLRARATVAPWPTTDVDDPRSRLPVPRPCHQTFAPGRDPRPLLRRHIHVAGIPCKTCPLARRPRLLAANGLPGGLQGHRGNFDEMN
jgi:hypothetical protein